ncbi:hypothetical protein NMS_0667 [Nonlabens marinus S1-08]|uniref:Uncharacterized protein n=1 Tax=Nonlabens marinus S1-08 TaxID=1454201 RepID=W8VZJ3_9FLAO|nr:hypothetical protein NMS_0667 [Nonlabens marinus S1-08]
MQDVKTSVAFVPRHNIAGDISQRMSHVKPGTTRIWEHIESIEFGFIRMVLGVKSAVFGPIVLPF